VTPRYGTDVTHGVDGRIFGPPLPGASFDPYKIVHFDKEENRKGGSLYDDLFPTGEFNIAPIEGSANGKLVVDLTMHHLGRRWTPIELTVDKGRVTKIDGGADARILRDDSRLYGDDNACMCPAEASVGVNAKAMVRGVQREDKIFLAPCILASEPALVSVGRSNRRFTWTGSFLNQHSMWTECKAWTTDDSLRLKADATLTSLSPERKPSQAPRHTAAR